MPEPSLFRHYLIAQDAEGGNVELLRDAEQVCVLGFDTRRLEFVHCHVLLEPLKEPNVFDGAVARLQARGHPLLAKLSDHGEDEGNPYYITSHIDGETLAEYLGRLSDIPLWLATLVSLRSLVATAALAERSEVPLHQPLACLRVVQTSHQNLIVQVADYPLLPSARRAKGLKAALEKQGKFLKDFLSEKAGSSLPCADFAELLSACLQAVSADSKSAVKELIAALQRTASRHPAEEIATALKPRSLLATHLAGYQEVARILVNRVRFQSQRLDMANPYAMRGTLTRSGRAVLVEQTLPDRLATHAVRATLERHAKAEGASQGALVPLPLIHEADGISCMAEEVVEGISLADLLLSRQALNVHETYLVLAGLDAALHQLENSGLEAIRLRLEDIHLLTGFPREDARSLKLLMTQLTDWPAFSVMLRAHPTLASMSGRGTDPAVLLPPNLAATWDAAWLSALGQFLLSLEMLPGAAHAASFARGSEIETVSRLFDDEIAKSREGQRTKRGDFLARYARIVHHHDLAKEPTVKKASGPLDVPAAKPMAKPRTAGLQPISSSSGSRAAEDVPAGAASFGALNPVIAPIAEKPSVGFAELLFRGTSETAPASGPDWARTAVDAPPTIHPDETLLPEELVPLWLRMAVFFGGSMVAGAVLAHVSGHALWQQTPPRSSTPPAIQVKQSATPSVPKAIALPKAQAMPEEPTLPVPRAAEVPELTPLPASNLLKPPPGQRDSILRSAEVSPGSSN